MESSIVTAIFLPIALSIMMLGMGINLSLKDFRLILEKPRLVLIGLVTQVIGMPLIAWAIAIMSGLTPELAIGLVLIVACPIGTIANVMVHIAKGDSAYSISLTAISSILCVLTLPFIVNLASLSFLGQATHVYLPFFSTVLQVFLMIIFPVSLGILLKHYRPGFALKLDKPLRITSLLFLIVIVTGAILKERSNIQSFIVQAGAATLVLN
ncbi:MAG: bile acid:sodium symporter family protein, partial [Proteobacteria bacterium]